jgi:hypothetical protein
MNRFLKFLEWYCVCFGTALMVVAALAAPAHLFAATKPTGSCAETCAAQHPGRPLQVDTCTFGCCETQCAGSDDRPACVAQCATNSASGCNFLCGCNSTVRCMAVGIGCPSCTCARFIFWYCY